MVAVLNLVPGTRVLVPKFSTITIRVRLGRLVTTW
jgi:hypothetical protein